MKIQLIKLTDKFILVSDEKTLSQNGDFYLGHPNYDTVHQWKMEGIHKGKSVWINKIIAGIPELPSIDFSLLNEEDYKTIGWVDVEKLHQAFVSEIVDEVSDWNKDRYTDGQRKQSWKQLFDRTRPLFKTAQPLNDKRFSLEDMKQCFLSAREFNSIDGVVDIDVILNFTNDNSDLQAVYVNFEDYIQSLQQTSWDVEVEMEHVFINKKIDKQWNVGVKGHFEPKITNNSIRVIKLI